MATQFPHLALSHRSFIAAQQLFVAATAAATGQVNTSPKGMDSLRVLGPNRILWRNSTNSGNETAGHLGQNPRMTLIWCAFDAEPLILRCYGTAHMIHQNDMLWAKTTAHSPPDRAARQIFDMTVDVVQTSCGFGVPLMDYWSERPEADAWTDRKGPDGTRTFWAETNRLTLANFPTGIEANL